MMSGLGRGAHRRSCSLGRDEGSSSTPLRRAAGSAPVPPAALPGSAASPTHSLLHPEPTSRAPAIFQASSDLPSATLRKVMRDHI